MARSFTICRNVTTTLTRSDTVITLNAFAASVLALLQEGGTYAMGADQVYVQWDNTSFNVVIEDAVMAAASGDLAAFKANIRMALLSLAEISALSVDDISTLEQSSVAGANVTTDGVALLGIAWTSGTQVPALTAAGVATVIAVGTGANAIPRRDSSGNMPSPYPDDTWDYAWQASDGDPTGLGWTQLGSQTMTVASTTVDGVACYSLTGSGVSGTSFIGYATGVAATGSFEIRAKIHLTLSSGTAPRFALLYVPNATSASSGRIEVAITSTGVALYNNSALTVLATVGSLLDQWIDLTLRVYKHAVNGAGGYFFEIWLGPVLVGQGQISAFVTNGLTAGTIGIGRVAVGTTQAVQYIESVKFRSGINAAPPSWVFRTATYPM